MNPKVNPFVEWSIGQTGPNQWIIGSKVVCESVQHPEPKPVDVLVSWIDGNRTFYLRRRTPEDTKRKGNTEANRVGVPGVSSAVWCIGDRIFKAHAWCGGMELESANIRFVKAKVPSLPVPDIIYEEIDPGFNRSFLVTTRITGRTLEERWPNLGPHKRELLASDVASYINRLAKNTSSSFKTISGCGVFEPRLLPKPNEEHRPWLPRLLGPFKGECDMRNYMMTISNEFPPEIGHEFRFYHAELGPKNIILANNDAVAGIINWEFAAYYPSLWLITKPLLGSFDLESDPNDPRGWANLLRDKLQVSNYTEYNYTEQERIYNRWVKGML
ncbi:unnamed protein product [Clonostachys byssicola]|uniref:Aminoglycoside phosphotransferase domain-containing protein n=1 Tax=Clonostachys byssicola TaxID=160290 RepID=A0A9N9UAE1_9HYPO|nr:unnamed protein product [Clonostachys byssicola]